jgi:hypothetical protein
MPGHHILLLLLFFSALQYNTPPCSAAITNDTLAAGKVLTVGHKLVSRNGKFALGFFQYQYSSAPSALLSKSGNTTTSRSRTSWYLGIWFNKIPVFTTVWVANREVPITGPNINKTQLKLGRDSNLLVVIINRAGNNRCVIWSTSIPSNNSMTTGTGSRKTTSAAVLLNTGNLAIIESPSSDVMLWQSFDHPTDVLLPGAKAGRNKITGSNALGISRKSLIDPGLGSYSLELDATGIVLKRRAPSMVYWSWLSTSSQALTPILKSLIAANPQTRGLINLTYVNNDEEEYYMYTSPDESSSSFVSLDISGQIKLNVWSQANQSWQNVYAQPADPCTPSATCGPDLSRSATAKQVHFVTAWRHFLGSRHRIGSLRIEQEAASEILP